MNPTFYVCLQCGGIEICSSDVEIIIHRHYYGSSKEHYASYPLMWVKTRREANFHKKEVIKNKNKYYEKNNLKKRSS